MYLPFGLRRGDQEGSSPKVSSDGAGEEKAVHQF